MASGSARADRTTSMSGMRWTGEKKCMPTTRSGARGRGLRDAGAHEAEADHADGRDGARTTEALEHGLPLVEREESEGDQVLPRPADCELAQRAGLGVQAGGHALREAGRDRVDRGQGRRIA